MKDIVISSTIINKQTLEIKEIENKEHEFEYRHSKFFDNNDIILSSKFKLKKGHKEEIKKQMDLNLEFRKEKQPINFPNAGSTFKRGKDFLTAKLIDECGLKGYNIGDAYVSDLHSGFIINKGNATAKNMLDLIEHIQKVVYNKCGQKIELEIEVLGED